MMYLGGPWLSMGNCLANTGTQHCAASVSRHRRRLTSTHGCHPATPCNCERRIFHGSNCQVETRCYFMCPRTPSQWKFRYAETGPVDKAFANSHFITFWKKKKGCNFRCSPHLLDGAQEKTRTSTVVKTPAPEAGASTNFATWATF